MVHIRTQRNCFCNELPRFESGGERDSSGETDFPVLV